MRYSVTHLQTSTVEISDESLIAWALQSLDSSSTASEELADAIGSMLRSNTHFRSALVSSYLVHEKGEATPRSVQPRPE